MSERVIDHLSPQGTRLASEPVPAPATQPLVQTWLACSLILAEDWELLPAQTREGLIQCQDPRALLSRLVQHGLLTEYQAARAEAGKASGLILGNYRVLDRLGAGAMGVVFKAENMRMRRPVALKVLAQSHWDDARLLPRFFAEMRVIAQLQHPNIVAAMDAGEVSSPEFGSSRVPYLVMEYVPGQDLEECVEALGPFSSVEACSVSHQVASALAEVHKQHLVHRDLKPSNIRVTPEGQAKLLDFGLARHFGIRRTDPGTLLGTLDYMAPEQAQDPRTVDIRADLYSLGGTLFWCLTGRIPFPRHGKAAQELARRLSQPPPSVRSLRPDIAKELDALVARLMAVDPSDRYRTPEEVMQALLPFIKPELREQLPALWQGPAPLDTAPVGTRAPRVLIVDDEPCVRKICGCALRCEELAYDEATNGQEALEALKAKPYDLILLDIDMPVLDGREVLRRLREEPPWLHLKVITFSGRATADELAQMMMAGADDYLTKPFSLVQLRARVRAALRLNQGKAGPGRPLEPAPPARQVGTGAAPHPSEH